MSMAESTRPDAAEHHTGARNALVCGIDLTGFTHWVDEEIYTHGTRRLEAIANDLSAFLSSASSILAKEEFLVASLLGDGLLGVRFAPADDEGAAKARICAALNRLEPRARLAFGRGSVERRTFAGLPGTSHAILAGEAVRRCYRALEERPRMAGRRRPPAPVQPSIARFGTSEICHLHVGFMAFRVEDFASLGRFIDQNLPIWQAGALARRGLLERLTYDDDALLVRFAWPVAAIDTAEVRDYLTAQFDACPPSMRAGWGTASGPIFRARLAGVRSLTGEDLDVAQGPAINHAAKQAKRMLDGARAASIQPSRKCTPCNMPRKAFAGRQAELTWISEHIADRRRLVMVTGEAGIGKSSLIEAAAQVQAETMSILRVAGRPGDVLEPLGLWREGAPIDKQASVDVQFSSLFSELTLQAARKPLLIVADDLQWTDPYSRRMIDELVRKVPSVTILAAGRPGTNALVETLDAEDLLCLRGMSAADIETLAQFYCDPPSPHIAALAGGNPFLAVQLALDWRAGRETTDIAGSTAAVIDFRLTRLAPSSLSALRLFAVADHELDTATMERVCTETGIAFDPKALRDLSEEQFLKPGNRPGALTVAHRLIQQRVIEQIPPSAMMRVSAVIARLLRSGLGFAAGLGAVGEHLRNAGQWHRAAISDASDAEHALTIHAHGPAAELFGRAIVGFERAGASADRMALVHAGDGLASWGDGNVTAALAASTDSAAAIAAAMPWRVRVRVVIAVATGRRHLLPPRLALSLVRHAALRSELGYFTGNLSDIMAGGLIVSRLGDDRTATQLARTRSLGLLALGLGLIGLDRIARAIFVRCQRVGGDRLPAAYAFCAEALYHFAQGAWAEGDRCIASSEARLGKPRDQHLNGALLCMRALSLHMRGETAQALAAFDTLLQLGRERGNRQFEAWALYGSAMPLIAAERFAEATARVEEASALMEDNADLLSTLNCCAIRAQLAWIGGDAASAIDHVETCLGLARGIFPANFGSLDGFTLPALVLADIVGSAKVEPALQARARTLAPEALAQSRKFASRCLIGGPRLAAARAALAKKESLRCRYQARAQILSRSLGMRLHLTRAVPANRMQRTNKP